MHAKIKLVKKINKISFVYLKIVSAGSFVFLLVCNYIPQTPYGIKVSLADANLYTSSTEKVLASQVGVSQFQTGATLTGYSLDSWGNSAAVANGKTLLNNSTSLIAQHIYGFGVTNFPIGQDGTQNWTDLDKRMALVNNGNTLVLTACCAPPWMEVPDKNGETGNFTPFQPPKEGFYDMYAQAVVSAVNRYPVTHVQVWNEMKGFWNESTGEWDYVAYTKLYNKIYNAVKTSKPNVKVGGPYVVVSTSAKAGRGYNSDELKGTWGWADERAVDVIKYWMQNKDGADFISIDVRNHRDNNDLIPKPTPAPELLASPFDQNQKFADINQWIRSLNNQTYPGASSLPIWYSEWYSRINLPDPNISLIKNQTNQGTIAQRNAVMTHGLIQHVKFGSSAAFLWGPQGEADTDGWMQPLALFTNTRVSGGGVATPFYSSQKFIKDHFSSGVSLVQATSSNVSIETLASNKKLILVNKTSAIQTASVLGASFTLQPYEVRLEDVPKSSTSTNVTNPVPQNPVPLSNSEEATSENNTLTESVPVTAMNIVKSEEDEMLVSNDIQVDTKPTVVEKIVDNFEKAVDDFYVDSYVEIGNTKVAVRPFRYVSFATFVVSTVAIITLERKTIARISYLYLSRLRSIFTRFRHV